MAARCFESVGERRVPGVGADRFKKAMGDGARCSGLTGQLPQQASNRVAQRWEA